MSDKNDVLNELEIYTSALKAIDTRIPLLEKSDIIVNKERRHCKQIKHKLSGLSFFLYWIMASAVCFLPTSMLNEIIDTDFNIVLLSPALSFVVLYLIKMKYEVQTKKNQMKIAEATLKEREKENKKIVGEINYLASIANVSLSHLMITKDEYDIADTDIILINTVFLEYAYGYIINKGLRNTWTLFSEAKSHFEDILNSLIESEENPDLLNQYHIALLQAQYRCGIIKHCYKTEE